MLDYTKRFDRLAVSSMADLELPQTALQAALTGLPGDQRSALQQAADRVREYHQKQLMSSWSYTEADGTMLGATGDRTGSGGGCMFPEAKPRIRRQY